MLQSIRVKNLALVDDITINFNTGLNILTGETGAGKSIIINSINLCLGAKSNKTLIAKNKDFALIELSFKIDEKEQVSLNNLLDEIGVSSNDENSDIIFISRKIGEKNICKINGELVNLKTLQLIGSYLLDAHTQHETSKLLNTNQHINILDECSNINIELKNEVKNLFNQWNDINKKLKKAQEEKEVSNKELSFAKFEINEIQNVNLKEKEDENLEEQYKLMSNSKDIYDKTQLCLHMFSNDSETSIRDMIGIVNKEFGFISDVNETTNEIYSRILDLESYITDLSYDLSSFLQSCEFDEHEILEVENRLNEINSLKNKYGHTFEEINNYLQERINYVNKMENYEDYVNGLIKEEKEIKKKLDVVLDKLSESRIKNAKIIEKQIENSLHELNFEYAKFRINITNTTISSNGKDKVEFMVVLNKGTDEKSLAQIASGGELSRVMLAIKSIIAQNDNVATLIFDEIDSGISGDTAWLVGKKLYETSKSKQVLCITHLPQIAAFASSHYKIEKIEINDIAQTNIEKLDFNGSKNELKRICGINNDAVDLLFEKANSLK